MANLTVGIPYTDDTEPGNKTESGENKRNKKQRTVRPGVTTSAPTTLKQRSEPAFEAALSMRLQCQEILTNLFYFFFCLD